MSPSRSDLQLEPGVHPNDWHKGFKGGAAGGHRSTVFSIQDICANYVQCAERSGWGSLGVTQSAQILGRNRQRIEQKSENSALLLKVFLA